MSQMARLVSLALMATLIVVLGVTFYQVVEPFLMPLFLAGVLAILCQPFYQRILIRTGGRKAVAAGVTTAAALLLILGPTLLGTIAATKQMYSFAEKTLTGKEWKSAVKVLRTKLDFDEWAAEVSKISGEEYSADDLEHEIDERIQFAAVTLAKRTLGFVGSTLTILGNVVSVLVGLMIFGVALYYFLADGPALIQSTQELIPVHREYQQQLLMQFDQAVRAVVTATFAAALGQGIATGIGMSIAGSHHFFLVTIFATLTALVPLLGTWLIWGPYAVWLAWNDQWGMAIFLGVYGAVFVGLLDNVIRTYVLNSNVKLHPLLAFISVLGGLQVMGLWGVFIGPIVASCLHALVKIFNTELQAFSLERRTRTVASGKSDKSASIAPDSASSPSSNSTSTANSVSPDRGTDAAPLAAAPLTTSTPSKTSSGAHP